MHYCYLKQGVQEYLTYHFTNCMSHNARFLEKNVFAYLHQSVALHLKTYCGTGEAETKCCVKCCLEVYMTQFFSYERTSNSRKIRVNHFLVPELQLFNYISHMISCDVITESCKGLKN